MVKIAVTKSGYSLKYASDHLRDDEEIVKIAIKNHHKAIYFASSRLNNNLDMLMLADDYGTLSLDNIHDKRILANRNFILKLIANPRARNKYDSFLIKYISSELREDYKILYYISLLPSWCCYHSRCFMRCNINGCCEFCGSIFVGPSNDHIPDKLRKLPNLTKWLKSQVDIKKGNGLQLYLNDYDISIVFFLTNLG